MAVAVGLAAAMPSLTIPLLVVALLVGFSRVMLGVHYPGDVVVEQAIALVARAPLARRRLSTMTSGPTAALTDVQVEVLLAVGAGITTAEIAQQRGVSASAVEQTIARICERLDIPRKSSLNQRVQLVQALNGLRGQVASR